jgi:hypothetical protein
MAAPVPVRPRVTRPASTWAAEQGGIEAAARSSGRAAGASGRRELPEPAGSLGVNLCKSAPIGTGRCPPMRPMRPMPADADDGPERYLRIPRRSIVAR